MGVPKDQVNVVMPAVLRDRLAQHRLHPRMAMHQVVKDALDFWEDRGAWTPFLKAPVEEPTAKPGA